MAEADALTPEEVEELCAHWNEEPPLAACVRTYLGVKQAEPEEEAQLDSGPQREISEEEWKRMCEREKSYAAEQNGRRNPFL